MHNKKNPFYIQNATFRKKFICLPYCWTHFFPCYPSFHQQLLLCLLSTHFYLSAWISIALKDFISATEISFCIIRVLQISKLLSKASSPGVLMTPTDQYAILSCSLPFSPIIIFLSVFSYLRLSCSFHDSL